VPQFSIFWSLRLHHAAIDVEWLVRAGYGATKGHLLGGESTTPSSGHAREGGGSAGVSEGMVGGGGSEGTAEEGRTHGRAPRADVPMWLEATRLEWALAHRSLELVVVEEGDTWHQQARCNTQLTRYTEGPSQTRDTTHYIA
jgi:hypothetical protein